jgi:hypothetical protein
MKQDTDQRPCAGCGSTTYRYTDRWNYATGKPRCLCAKCVTSGLSFTPEGRVIQASRLQLMTVLNSKRRAKEDTDA